MNKPKCSDGVEYWLLLVEKYGEIEAYNMVQRLMIFPLPVDESLAREEEQFREELAMAAMFGRY